MSDQTVSKRIISLPSTLYILRDSRNIEVIADPRGTVFLDDSHAKVVSLTPQLLSDLWFLVGIALKKVKKQTKQAQLCKALLNEAKMEGKEIQV